MNERGFTLVELLIAVAITAIVTAAGYVYFNNMFNFSIAHNRTADMQQDVRVAMDIMGREIRAAGFGVIDPLGGTVLGAVSPITPGNNVDSDPDGNPGRLDRMTLVGGYQQIAVLSANALDTANQITVTFQPGFDPTTVVGMTVTLGGFYYGTVIARAGNTLTLSAPLNRGYTALDAVIQIQTIVYSVGMSGTTPVLFRSVNGAANQIIASGIEDLQFAYLLNTGAESNNPAVVAPPSFPNIVAVRVSLLARALDPNRSATSVSIRPALEDHAAGAAPDRFHRRLLTKVVEVRNLGPL